MSDLVSVKEAAEMLACGMVAAKQWLHNHGFNALPCEKRAYYWRAHVEQVKAERIEWGLLDPTLFTARHVFPEDSRLDLPALPPTDAQIEAAYRSHARLDPVKVRRQAEIDEANRKRRDEHVDEQTLSILRHKAGGKKLTKSWRDAIADENRHNMEKRAKEKAP